MTSISPVTVLFLTTSLYQGITTNSLQKLTSLATRSGLGNGTGTFGITPLVPPEEVGVDYPESFYVTVSTSFLVQRVKDNKYVTGSVTKLLDLSVLVGRPPVFGSIDYPVEILQQNRGDQTPIVTKAIFTVFTQEGLAFAKLTCFTASE
jgi:hypothetical protein